MEDVVSYPIDRPSIGEKRLMMELANAVEYAELLPEKRSNNFSRGSNPNQAPMTKTIPVVTISGQTVQERGEKRSACEALANQTIPKEYTLGEHQEKEAVKRIAARVLLLPKEAPNSPLSVFHGINEPSISFITYVERLVHYANVWAREKPNLNSQGIRCAVLAVIYMERSGVVISSKSVHRLFLIAFLIGIKLTDDFGISNTFWGRAGGCQLEDVNRMEIAFCGLLGWDFAVSPDVFDVLKQNFICNI